MFEMNICLVIIMVLVNIVELFKQSECETE